MLISRFYCTKVEVYHVATSLFGVGPHYNDKSLYRVLEPHPSIGQRKTPREGETHTPLALEQVARL